MKNASKLLMLLLALVLSLSLFACGGGGSGDDDKCDECVDSNADGKCDECGEDIPEEPAADIVLFDDGVPNFRIVLGSGIATDVRKYVDQNIVGKLRNKYDIELVSAQEGGSNDVPQEIEVLIGDVTTRGAKYTVDRYQFGKEGYMIKIIGSKIVINAGSDEQLLEAVAEFAEDILKIGTDDLYYATMLVEDMVYKIQDDYKIESISVAGTDMKGYTIAADTTDDYYKAAALAIQDTIYDRTGYFLKIVKPEEASDKSIVLKQIDKISGDKSFTVKVDGTKLVISCAYDNMLEQATGQFLARNITLTSQKNINFEGSVYSQDISVVYYEDFGAKGDGKTDDFDAIYKTHEFANISGQTVKAKRGATYYIFDTSEPGKKNARVAIIRTNVDWQGAEFIIDDTNIGLTAADDYNYLNKNIFQIAADKDMKGITLSASKASDAEYVATILGDGITRNTTHITIPKEAIGGWEGAVMIAPQNSAHKVYRRRGYGASDGATMQEVIVVNPDGSISSETPVMFDFQKITSITIYKLDESTAIRVENGKFTTKACRSNIVFTNSKGQLEARGSYISRGLSITRSYTTLYNIEHIVEGELELTAQVDHNGQIVAGGPAYSGFYAPSNANHITIENCVLSGRRCYVRPQGGTTGTYDLSGNMVNYLVYKDCVQHNFWVTVDPETYEISPAKEGDVGAKTSMGSTTIRLGNGASKSLSMHWGIGGTNWCKNMIYDGSTLSRFDAHQGLYNGAIIDSTVNYIELTGNGLFEFTNSRWFSSGNNVLLPLRADYGWTWEGEMIVKNVDAFVYTNKTIGVCYFGYGNWYFGYTCAFPSISLDNVDFYDISAYYRNWTVSPIPAGSEIWLTDNPISGSTRMHLETSHTNPYYAVYDHDNDGFIDEPSFDHDLDGVVDDAKNYDLDGDGRYGNTRFDYASNYNNGEYDGDGKDSGIVDTDSYVNLCRVIPPEYIRIVNNDGVDGSGGYKYVMWDTSGQGVSDGKYYSDTDSFGGFFGGTKFIYGDGDNDYFLGTNHGDQTKDTPFLFR